MKAPATTYDTARQERFTAYQVARSKPRLRARNSTVVRAPAGDPSAWQAVAADAVVRLVASPQVRLCACGRPHL